MMMSGDAIADDDVWGREVRHLLLGFGQRVGTGNLLDELVSHGPEEDVAPGISSGLGGLLVRGGFFDVAHGAEDGVPRRLVKAVIKAQLLSKRNLTSEWGRRDSEEGLN